MMNVSLGLTGVTGSIAMRNRAGFAAEPALFERVKEGLGRLIAPFYKGLEQGRVVERVAEPVLDIPRELPVMGDEPNESVSPEMAKLIADLEADIARQMEEFAAEAAADATEKAAPAAPPMPDAAAVLARLAQLEVIPAAGGVAPIAAPLETSAAVAEAPVAAVAEAPVAAVAEAPVAAVAEAPVAAVAEAPVAAVAEAPAGTGVEKQAHQGTETVVDRVPAVDATARAMRDFDASAVVAEDDFGPEARLDAAVAAAGQQRRTRVAPAVVPQAAPQTQPAAVAVSPEPGMGQIVASGIVDGVAGVANAAKAVVTAPMRGVSAAAKALGALGRARREEGQLTRETSRGATLQQLTSHNTTGMEKAVVELAEAKEKLSADPKIGRLLSEVEEIAKDNHRGDVLAVTKEMCPGGVYEAIHQDWEAAIKGNPAYEAYELTARDLVRRMSRDMPKLSNTPSDLLRRYEESVKQGESLSRGIPARKGIDGNMLDSLHDKFVSFGEILKRAFDKMREVFAGKSRGHDDEGPAPH